MNGAIDRTIEKTYTVSDMSTFMHSKLITLSVISLRITRIRKRIDRT